MHHITSAVVCGKKIAPEQDVRPVSEHGSSNTEAVKEVELPKKDLLERETRSVFGAGCFGRRLRGPCPP